MDYSHANWGYARSDNKNFPITTKISSQLIEFPQEILLGNRDLMDYIIKTIKDLRESFISS